MITAYFSSNQILKGCSIFKKLTLEAFSKSTQINHTLNNTSFYLLGLMNLLAREHVIILETVS